jgi:hypothetical protein
MSPTTCRRHASHRVSLRPDRSRDLVTRQEARRATSPL